MSRPFIIADNQDITKAGLFFLLSQQKEPPQILLEATNKQELVMQLRLHSDAVVVLDYTLLDITTVEELLVIHERFPQADWLLFCDELSPGFLRRVVYGSSAFGIALKDCSREEISAALQSTMLRQRYICHHVSNQLLSTSPTATSSIESPLTATEQSILKEIAMGKTTKEIAAQRNLSFHTVNSHRKNIFRKLNVNNAHEAARYAVKAGVVDLVEYYI